MRFHTLAALVAVFLGLFLTQASAQISRPAPTPSAQGGNLLASDPEAIRDAIQAAGFQAILKTGSDGDPVITSRISKSPVWIYFLHCSQGANCKALRLHVGYRMDRPTDFSEMNEFMQKYAYVRAFLNEDGNPRIQYDLPLREDGMGPENFRKVLELWRQLVGLFEEHMGVSSVD